MKKYLFLSSAFIMTTLGAFGADGTITGGPNTCTVDVLGVSDNNATAKTIATWTMNEYTVGPSRYLYVTDTDVINDTCKSGFYCPGGEYTVETANNSIKSCPIDYPYSKTGSRSNIQCYKACTTDMVPQSTTVTGNDYYGSGTDTCEPTACIAGWHLKPGFNLEKTIGETDGINSAHIDHHNNFNETNYDNKDSKGQEYYNINDINSFAVDYGEHGMITGHGRCSTQSGNNNEMSWLKPTIINNLPDETNLANAIYCYCKLDFYINKDSIQTETSSAPWIFYNIISSADTCANTCSKECAGALKFWSSGVNSNFRRILFYSASTPATCEANTINIDWNPDNGGEHTINQCTYEGSITVPADPVKPGYIFTGWKLVE